MRLIAFLLPVLALAQTARTPRWTESKANAWYAAQPWLVGANYIPASAINQLEMWQNDSFDASRIDKELGWAEHIGMNTMRVFLHDLLYAQDAEGFKKRIDRFLTIAHQHGIRPVFVLFDSCWDPSPQLGRQRAPRPGVHNSGWVQSPGAKPLQDPSQAARLEAYVKGVVGAFATDDRILAWDVWNEPDNRNDSSYGTEEPANKVDLVYNLLGRLFEWARSVPVSQPLTSGVWKGDWSENGKLSRMERLQLDNSDVISFHNYGSPTDFEQHIQWLERYHRPLICTEYMARGNGSFFQGSLPVAMIHHVAMINWGLVQGKTQTNLPWDSWQHPYVDREPSIWFHEVFRTDGTPYQPEEVEFIRRITRRGRTETRKEKAAFGLGSGGFRRDVRFCLGLLWKRHSAG
jgi:hypothetical protein